MTEGAGFFHLHLVSDATGETLINIGRAAAAQYRSVAPVEHLYSLVRTPAQLERVVASIEEFPGIVLFTFVDEKLVETLKSRCLDLGCPCLSVLAPVMDLFRAYLGAESTSTPGAQHELNADYFKRIDAMNFTMLHDDGQNTDDLRHADVVLLGISRTSKTPTSIYLANRGLKTANVPLVPALPIPDGLEGLKGPLIVGLVATPDRIMQIRQNRLLGLAADGLRSDYADLESIEAEIAFSRRLCARNNWPVIDVTRRSIEETAAAILRLYQERNRLERGSAGASIGS